MLPAIKFENISKEYRLGLVTSQTLNHDLQRWWKMNIQGKEDPYLKIGEVNDRTTKGTCDYIWALKDINFEVQEGDVLGIIGQNGAGKSTLLKILSKVTAPTTGTIKANGRIASLLEVGTGFHPEMTGRENIYMNGAILGMNKSEIRSKFEEIVDFSGVERYIDTPVKRYSSGMMVRLGFAVAAHLDPEILVVDEVLAVGDAEFQKKAIGKMGEISKGEGRTVLFVSHSMKAISDLCNRAVLFSNGSVLLDDTTKIVVEKYLETTHIIPSKATWLGDNAPGNDCLKLRRGYIINSESNIIENAFINQRIGLCIEYEVIKDIPYFTHGINVFNIMEQHLFTSHDDFVFNKKQIINRGFYKTVVWIPENLLQDGDIIFSFACMRYDPFEVMFHEKNLLRINMLDTIKVGTKNSSLFSGLPGLVRPHLMWDERVLLK